MIMAGIVTGFLTIYFGSRYYKGRFEKEIEKISLYYFFTVLLCGTAGWLFYEYGYDMTKALRLIILAAALVIIGKIDSLEKIIPNLFIAYLAVVRTILLVADCVGNMSQAGIILSAAVLGIIYGSVVFIIARIFAKGSIGMGDIKLFAVIGYYLGSTSVIPAIIMSLLVAMFYGIMMICRKKMTMKDTISFGPYIAIGTILVIIIGG